MNLPYPSMDFVPFDVLTASEMDKMVSNIEYLSNNVLDTFYPVGSYYETSNESFDPNVSWGGSWVLDSEGRVTVSQDSGTFSTIGATGGSESHDHEYKLRYYEYYGNISYNFYAYNYRTNAFDVGSGSNVSGNVNGNTASSAKSVSRPERTITTYTNTSSNLPPYVVVKRWHRVA